MRGCNQDCGVQFFFVSLFQIRADKTTTRVIASLTHSGYPCRISLRSLRFPSIPLPPTRVSDVPTSLAVPFSTF
uniref:Uncharacterized protein n=1 Tax=Utricularia reniformis TaxID=192314 RepID=A0A1Y0AZJ8_9LAMI|nr:hypothetical protein AEK19_MT0287 [Utricularia reniformis]ART30563.1 hypothetical protein AEK19_MT0287 [Utricularia reniformis]